MSRLRNMVWLRNSQTTWELVACIAGARDPPVPMAVLPPQPVQLPSQLIQHYLGCFCRVLHCTAQNATVAVRAMQQDWQLQQVLPRRTKVIEFPSIIIHLDVTYSRSSFKKNEQNGLDKQDFLKATGLFLYINTKIFNSQVFLIFLTVTCCIY